MLSGFFEEIDEYFEKRALKPDKWTYLHELIEYSISEDIDYALRKGDPLEFAKTQIEPLIQARSVKHYQTPAKYKNHVGDDDTDENLWISHIREKFDEHVLDNLTNEVFTLLYVDRKALLQLNKIIAKTIKCLKLIDHPKLLEANGIVKRCTYWPKWLRNALFYREKGHCSLCLKDISGLFAAGKELEIDHIVPLNLGGTNDPTNLQILCENCNSKKGGGLSQTSNFQHIFWSIN